MSVKPVFAFDIMEAGLERAAEMAALHNLVFPRGWPPDAIATLLDAPGVCAVVAQEASAMAHALGFIMTRKVLDEAEIYTLAVAPGHRRNGLATALLAEALARLAADGVRAVFLEVASGNAAGCALYAAAGFVEAGRRPGYYGQEGGQSFDDALIMRRDLASPCPAKPPAKPL